MTDLEKAKQYREQRFGTSPWMETTDVDKMLAAYASHSNSELLERVQKLEQVILWANGENGDFPPRLPGQGAYWWRTELMERAALAKAPDTRNV